MPRRTLLIVIMAGLALVVLLLPAMAEEDPDVFEDGGFAAGWVNKIFGGAERPPAVFDHDGEHNDKAGIEDCQICHHVYENGNLVPDESSDDQPCLECHKPDTDDDSTPLMKAYHLNCKGCHEKQKKGPVTCGECHVRK